MICIICIKSSKSKANAIHHCQEGLWCYRLAFHPTPEHWYVCQSYTFAVLRMFHRKNHTLHNHFKFYLFLNFFNLFFITYFPQLHFQCYPKSLPYTPPTHTPLSTHSDFLALAFPCTGAYKVCKSNGPLFPVMAD